MRRSHPLLILFALTVGLSLSALASADQGDITKINGTVRVAAGEQAGDISTINGAIRIADDATIKEATAVNGAIELGSRAQAAAVDTVNGTISLGADSRVSGEVNAVNGSIRLERNAEVAGRVQNVNGTIVLDAARVAAGIGTVSGNITVGADSQVSGGILVEKDRSWFSKSRAPVVVIGPRAVVQGTLEFRRDVVLKVSDSAQIGPVKGATPVKFSGATP